MLSGVLELGDDLCVTKDGVVVAREDPVLYTPFFSLLSPKDREKLHSSIPCHLGQGQGQVPSWEKHPFSGTLSFRPDLAWSPWKARDA